MTTAEKFAHYLLQIKAIQLSVQKPFTWASGWKSPIYCDNRQVLSYPEIRSFVRDCLMEVVETQYASADVIAGVATGGIAHGVLVADRLKKPFIYVRSSAKEHGMQRAVEGHVEAGARVVMVEDLISSGQSSLKAVEAVRRETGAGIVGLVALFTYGFEAADRNFRESAVPFTTLSDYETLVRVAVSKGYIEPQHEEVLTLWSKDPAAWGR